MEGNIIENDIENEMNLKMTYFIFKRFKMFTKIYVYILLFSLFIALFVERYSFAVAVYKTKNYGGILIFLVILFNTIFLKFIQILR